VSPAVVLLDTNVFTAQLSRRSPLVGMYAQHLVGSRIVVTPQSVAEARYGALRAGWGSLRLAELERLIHRAGVLPVDDDTVWSFARLRAECHRVGHPLHQKEHMGDLWIAAAALRWDLPLVAHDRVFLRCPGLTLRSELEAATDPA
jgi:predicted nucleic acid-binding protein